MCTLNRIAVCLILVASCFALQGCALRLGNAGSVDKVNYQIISVPNSVHPGGYIIKMNTATGETWFSSIAGLGAAPSGWTKF